MVVVIVVVEGLTKEVLVWELDANSKALRGSTPVVTHQAMKVVEPFNVRWKAPTILFIDLDLIVLKA